MQLSHIAFGPHLHPFVPFFLVICPFLPSQYLSTSSSTTCSHGLGPPARRGGATGVSAAVVAEVGASETGTTLPDKVEAVATGAAGGGTTDSVGADRGV